MNSGRKGAAEKIAALVEGAPDVTGVDLDVLRRCAALDQSDTDNGKRLIAHFGRDLCVLQTSGARNMDYIAWTGTHWDAETGNDRAFAVAQDIGALILREAELIEPRKGESEAAFETRVAQRRRFAVSSKNKARLEAMLACAAPKLLRRADEFNADQARLATLNHTLFFDLVSDPDCPDPDVERKIGRLTVRPGHSREDFITQVVPVAYDPDATCPRWMAFLDRFLPVDSVRRCVQVFCGLGLTGVPLQRLLFHYGEGANGKSTFLEALMRVVGPLGVSLPAESLVGEQRNSGAQASPDLARLFGARLVRVSELPEGEPVKEALVKKLTGGEKIPVRNLFKGFFDFQPQFKAHLSGNGYPRIDGTDHGIWRRMTVIHWPVQLAEHEQRGFEDVVCEFVAEAPGILNWLIDGVLIYLAEGFLVPDAVKSATEDYRNEMDPVGQFIAACVDRMASSDDPEQRYSVKARDMYDAYVAWAEANGMRPLMETKFGRIMRTKLTREDGRIRRYVDCRLHDVPPRPVRQERGS